MDHALGRVYRQRVPLAVRPIAPIYFSFAREHADPGALRPALSATNAKK